MLNKVIKSVAGPVSSLVLMTMKPLIRKLVWEVLWKILARIGNYAENKARAYVERTDNEFDNDALDAFLTRKYEYEQAMRKIFDSFKDTVEKEDK